ncbi:DegT/DnrJ/EryC1/StrS family aminotransferase [Streptomyces aureocirculatus]|uniref:DegT/DnrJ/EryC1/StrS family aminotransferase n=1 Tax=Streptomyces aureocirculatus TaxID=67275 RepID=UPI00099DCE55|nr:DegT/DnrJ/EryC1/StrS aminotransferase family protein [Streptomyces aureocirculatus]
MSEPLERHAPPVRHDRSPVRSPVAVGTRDWALPFGRPRHDEREISAVTAALRSGDLATGRTTAEFEAAFAARFGFRHAVAVTSGSTANLLALAAVAERHGLRPGDRVVVSGATFISAVTPVVQLGLTPVFADTEPGGVNVDLDLVDQAVRQHGAKAALLPHALGQSLDSRRLGDLVQRSGAVLIEDCCESLGATDGRVRVGGTGALATFSFYAGHHLTMGEGGVIACDDPKDAELLRSLRAFGRDFAYSGERMRYPVGRRRVGGEERYIHLRVGYNAKLTDFQAAFGLVQLTREPEMAEERRAAARALCEVVADFPRWRVLGDPTGPGASPFAVPLLAPAGAPLGDIADVLAAHSVEPRGFLGASLPEQPCFDALEHVVHQPYAHAHELAARGLLIGCPPGLDLTAATTALAKALRETI